MNTISDKHFIRVLLRTSFSVLLMLLLSCCMTKDDEEIAYAAEYPYNHVEREPNDIQQQEMKIQREVTYRGELGSKERYLTQGIDTDWYSFQLEEEHEYVICIDNYIEEFSKTTALITLQDPQGNEQSIGILMKRDGVDYYRIKPNVTGRWHIRFDNYIDIKTKKQHFYYLRVQDIDCNKSTGLTLSYDRNWYLLNQGEVEDVTGLYYDKTYGWWLLENGKINFSYNDMYYDDNYGWWKITNGTVDFGYNDLYFSYLLDGWWKIKNGTIDWYYNDLYFSPGLQSWWKITDGYLDFWYDDLLFSPGLNSWWKITGGTIDFGYDDLFFSPGLNSWWKVTNGYIDFGYNDLFFSPGLNSWWKVAGGTIDFGYYGAYYSPGLNSWWNIWGGMLIF